MKTDLLSALAATYSTARFERGEINDVTHRHVVSRLHSLIRGVGDMPVNQLDRHAIEQWQRSIGRHSPATRRSYLSAIKVFCAWLVDEGHLAADPTARVARVREPRRVPRALPTDSIAGVLDAADQRLAAILWLMVGLGLRCCEVANVELGDWDRHLATMVVRGKADHERVLPVPVEVAAALAAYLDVAGWSAGPLVRNRGRAVSANWLSKHVSAALAAAGVKSAARDGISAHALRHTAASDVYERCHDIRTVQEMMGHASIATTQIYLRRANLDQLREAMAGRGYGTAA